MGPERERRNELSILSSPPHPPIPHLGSFFQLGALGASRAVSLSAFLGSAGIIQRTENFLLTNSPWKRHLHGPKNVEFHI